VLPVPLADLNVIVLTKCVCVFHLPPVCQSLCSGFCARSVTAFELFYSRH